MTDPSALYAGVRWRRLTSAFGVDPDIRSWRYQALGSETGSRPPKAEMVAVVAIVEVE